MSEKLDGWAIVEVMGHSRYAGKVSEHTIGATAFVRIDVPEASESVPGFTKFLGAGSIFAITPVTEEVARAAVAGWRSEPVALYGLGLRREASPLIGTDEGPDYYENPTFE